MLDGNCTYAEIKAGLYLGLKESKIPIKWMESIGEDVLMKSGFTGRLAGKVALVTGGTSGIGKATMELFCREGCQVLFTGRRRELGEQLVKELTALGGSTAFVYADHTVPEDCARVVAAASAEFGGIDILFNNAGLVVSGTAESTSDQDWDITMALNVTAVWRMSKLVLPHMRARGGGAIVNNASDWGVVAGKEAVAYCTSKGAVIQMTKAMALDHAHENIRINAVCPGDTLVERWLEEGYYVGSGGVAEQTVLEQGKSLPIGRVARAEEIAKAVLFLASEEASYITGTSLLVDGGNTAR
jgi:NAD(P)-dependent dehydrogenase (short-subunit alcohol dehydrogenase family)